MKYLIALTALFLALPTAHAEMVISNPLVDFKDTRVDGYGQTTKVTVQNLNSTAAQVMVSTNDCYDNFYVYNDCQVPLEPNQACTVEIRFQPYQFGHLACSIAVQDSLGGSGKIEVKGRGVAPN